MPRYWTPGFRPIYYCWADSEEQALAGMIAHAELLEFEYNKRTPIKEAINQHPEQCYNVMFTIFEPDFRVKSDA